MARSCAEREKKVEKKREWERQGEEKKEEQKKRCVLQHLDICRRLFPSFYVCLFSFSKIDPDNRERGLERGEKQPGRDLLSIVERSSTPECCPLRRKHTLQSSSCLVEQLVNHRKASSLSYFRRDVVTLAGGAFIWIISMI